MKCMLSFLRCVNQALRFKLYYLATMVVNPRFCKGPTVPKNNILYPYRCVYPDQLHFRLHGNPKQPWRSHHRFARSTTLCMSIFRRLSQVSQLGEVERLQPPPRRPHLDVDGRRHAHAARWVLHRLAHDPGDTDDVAGAHLKYLQLFIVSFIINS